MIGKEGHGHVVPRSDGTKEDCGGVAHCYVCQSEKRARDRRKAQDEEVTPVYSDSAPSFDFGSTDSSPSIDFGSSSDVGSSDAGSYDGGGGDAGGGGSSDSY